MAAGAMMYVYEVNGVGGCLVHFAEMRDDDNVQVQSGITLMPPGFFKEQKAMHDKMGHTFTMEAEYDGWVVWSVRIGHGDFQGMNLAILEMCRLNEELMEGKGNYERTNWSSPFSGN